MVLSQLQPGRSEPLLFERPSYVSYIKPDMPARASDVCFSNRPFGIKHIQTVHGSMLMSIAGSCFSSEHLHRQQMRRMTAASLRESASQRETEEDRGSI